jgi:hypothetical protein
MKSLARIALTLAVVIAAAREGRAQTATTTQTPTSTPTSTPTAERQGALAQGYTCGAGGTCPTPPCDVPITLPAQQGHKTVAIATASGSATTALMCRVAASYEAPEIALASMSGVTCTTPANCLKEFDAWCDELFLRVTACPTPARIHGWLRTDVGAR